MAALSAFPAQARLKSLVISKLDVKALFAAVQSDTGVCMRLSTVLSLQFKVCCSQSC